MPYRDIYGLCDILSTKKEKQNFLMLAEQKDKFEIAQLISEYLFRF